MDKYLSICNCPHNISSICLEDEDGSGTRLTPSKCCGKWHTLERWRLKPNELKRLAKIFEEAAND